MLRGKSKTLLKTKQNKPKKVTTTTKKYRDVSFYFSKMCMFLSILFFLYIKTFASI